MAQTAAPRPAETCLRTGRRGPDPAVRSARGPGAFFRDHPGLYALSLAGALGTAGYAAMQARKAEPGRACWWALAGLTATQAVAMAASKRRYVVPATAPGHDSMSPRRIEAPGRPPGCAARCEREGARAERVQHTPR